MIRTKLTAWNCVVLSFVLTAIGFAIYLVMRHQIYAAVDQNLARRARDFKGGLPDPPPPDRLKPPPGHTKMIIFEDRKLQAPGDFSSLERLDPNHLRLKGIDPNQFLETITMTGTLSPQVIRVTGKDSRELEQGAWDALGFRKALRGETNFGWSKSAGLRLRVLSVPNWERGAVASVIQLAVPVDTEEKQLRDLANTLALALPLAVVIMMGTGFLLTKLALRPISAIANAAEEIQASDLRQRLPVSGKDEFAHLGHTFNAMLSRLHNDFEARERLYATQRRFTSDASHELRTPITAIKARAGVALAHDLSGPEYRKHLEAIDRSASLMSSIVSDLLLLAASDEGRLPLQTAPADFWQLVSDAVDSVDARGVSIRQSIQPNLVVECDGLAMTRVLVNLIENAARHSANGSLIEIESFEDAKKAEIRVKDRGCGIPPDQLDRVFQRFHRADPSRDRETGGNGLGLAIAKAIVEAHGFEITLASQVDRGTTVTISMPSASLRTPC